jgi:hypothetical protein
MYRPKAESLWRSAVPDGHADLALCHGKPRQRIHQQQHIVSAVPKVFRDRGTRHGAFQPDHGRLNEVATIKRIS